MGNFTASTGTPRIVESATRSRRPASTGVPCSTNRTGSARSTTTRAVPSALRVVIYRRLMVRIADRIARANGAGALITGEVIGTEGEVVITQDLISYEITGEDETGRLKGRHIGTGIVRPNFWERARYYNLEKELADALDKVNQ